MLRRPLLLVLALAPLGACSDPSSDPDAGGSDGHVPGVDDGGDASADEGADEGADDGADGADDGPPGQDGGEEVAVTYWQHAKPILDAKCAGCHYDGGVAPFPLETYADAKTYAAAARAVIEAGTMPPWQPDDACRQYALDRSLDDDQLSTLIEWIDLGAAEGDPALQGEPLPSQIPKLPHVDATLAMAQEFSPTKAPDEYRCFVLDLPPTWTGTKFVTGMEVKPGNLEIVHHVIAFITPASSAQTLADKDAADPGPGYECFGGAGVPTSGMLGGWAPGGGASMFGDDMGVRIDAGSKIVYQVHYNALNPGAQTDLSAIDLMVQDSVAREASIILGTDPAFLLPGGLHIPAGDPSVVHEGEVPRFLIGSNEPLEILAVGLHMHLLGKSGYADIERADGSRECLLDIRDWDFSWQGAYALKDTTILQPGDKLHVRCEHDNSAENQPYMGGVMVEPADTSWGEGTRDEMCLVPIVYAPL